MNQIRINELKAMLDFVARQSTTKVQLEAPDGTHDKNEIQILSAIVREVLDAIPTNVVVAKPAPAPVATVPDAKKA